MNKIGHNKDSKKVTSSGVLRLLHAENNNKNA